MNEIEGKEQFRVIEVRKYFLELLLLLLLLLPYNWTVHFRCLFLYETDRLRC